VEAEAEIVLPGATVCRYSLVVPVYRNESTVRELVDRIEELSARLWFELEAIFVIDGSPDRSREILVGLLSSSSLPSRIVDHSRNFGSFASIRTGLAAARGEYCAVMAADLQEPISLVEDFFRSLHDGTHDVAVGIRESRGDSKLSAWSSRTFWTVYRQWVQREMPAGGIDMFACTRTVRNVLIELDESNTSLVGLLIWLGFRRIEVPYDRLPRPSGKSGWTLQRRFRYLLDSTYSFTDLPITLLLAIGLFGVVASVVAGTVVVAAWAFGTISVAGYTPLMLTLLLGVSVIVSGLGIIGSYVWRTYENTKRRPSAIVMRTQAFWQRDDREPSLTAGDGHRR
jgi:glycosyltransferase involved in cell wall biosynthesis